jgi:hypothetical protein
MQNFLRRGFARRLGLGGGVPESARSSALMFQFDTSSGGAANGVVVSQTAKLDKALARRA